MRRTLVVLGGVVALFVSACGGGGGHPRAVGTSTTVAANTTVPNPVVTQAPSTTTTTVPPDPAVVPPVIDAAYVNAVFKVLDHILGDVTRLELSAGSVVPAVVARLRAVFADPEYATQLGIASRSLIGDLSNIRRPPGDRITTVNRILPSTPQCIFVETSTDYSQVIVTPGTPAASEYWQLIPKRGADDLANVSGTPWAISYNVAYPTPTDEVDRCAGS